MNLTLFKTARYVQGAGANKMIIVEYEFYIAGDCTVCTQGDQELPNLTLFTLQQPRSSRGFQTPPILAGQ